MSYYYPDKKYSLIPFFLLLLLLTLSSFLFSLLYGSTYISLDAFYSLLQGNATPLTHTLIYQLRLPRALTAFVTGALLSLAGVLMQALLRNPLADPYVLGLSGGSAFFALLAMLWGGSHFWITGSAFSGALLSTLLVFFLGKKQQQLPVSRLLLTGIILASGWGALISFIITITPPEKIHGMLFWLMGDLGYSYNKPLSLSYLILFFGLGYVLLLSRKLNIILWGELYAQSLGINSQAIHIQLLFLSSLFTASAITLAGSIGFIGLIIPHTIRLLIGSDHRFLLPASMLLGGSLLVIADTLARTILSPQQLPVGILTALVGIPVFLYLLNKS